MTVMVIRYGLSGVDLGHERLVVDVLYLIHAARLGQRATRFVVIISFIGTDQPALKLPWTPGHLGCLARSPAELDRVDRRDHIPTPE